MKRTLLLVAAVLCCSLPIFGQTVGPITITSTQCASIGVDSSAAVIGIEVIGTWGGTLQPKGTIQGQPAFNVQVTPSTSTTAQSTITANGGYTALVAGYSSLQVCGNTVTSGTASVYLNLSQASAGAGAGAGGAASFPTLTGGTNTSSAFVVGTTASLVPSDTGQITANGDFLSSAGLAGCPIPGTFFPTGSLTGGTLVSGQTLFLKITFNCVGSESIPAPEESFVLNAGNGCASGSSCSMTIPAPALGPGVTGYTVYSCMTAGSCTEKQQTALAACVNITGSCTVGTPGAGGNPPASQSPTVLPPGSLVNDCNPYVQPSGYILATDGKYHSAMGVDMITDPANGPLIGGTLHYCRRVMFDDSGYNGASSFLSRTPGIASAFSFFHAAGTNNGAGCCGASGSQDDRSVYVSNWSLAGDSSTRTGAQIGIYNESGVYGNPTLHTGVGLSPGSGLMGIRSNTFLNSSNSSFNASIFAASHEAVLEFDIGHVSGTSPITAAAMHGQVNYVSTETGSQGPVASFYADANLNSNATAQLTSYSGFYANYPTTSRAAANFGVGIADFGTNVQDLSILTVSLAQNSSRSLLMGPVVPLQGFNGGLTSLTQLTSPSNGYTVANIGTPGATTYQYKLVPKDSAGGWAPAVSLQTTTGNATLNGSNYNQIQITCASYPQAFCTNENFGIVTWDLYRVTAPTGLIAKNVYCVNTCNINDQGGAVTSDGNIEPSPPTNNTSGAVNAFTYRTNTNCAAVGTAASPSVASCGSAAAGQFSCATNATGATCTVNTTAVNANSEIFVQESDTATTGTRLGVTCNTGTNVLPASRLLASSVAGTSFTINLGTVTTNPACFSYHIVN